MLDDTAFPFYKKVNRNPMSSLGGTTMHSQRKTLQRTLHNPVSRSGEFPQTLVTPLADGWLGIWYLRDKCFE